MIEKEFQHLDETQTNSLEEVGTFHLQENSIIHDKFKVISLLGIGGMGSVYKVQHLHLNKMFALKCMNKTQFTDTEWRRFEVEVKAASRLDHPNLVRVYDSGLLPSGKPFFVMDLVEGKTLADAVKEKGMLSLEHALRIFVQVGFALSYAHQNGVIHRDIKPSNIMLVGAETATMSNPVKVVDFGLAKFTGSDGFNQQTLTKTGEIFGSPLYMSPEQCMGTSVDHRSDLYSFGCVIYETLTGAPPLIGDSALSTMLKHQSESPLPMKEASLGREFPRKIESIVEKLLEKDPAKRYQDATTLTAELVSLEQKVKEGANAVSGQHSSAREVSYDKTKKRSNQNWLVIGLAYLLGIATGLMFQQKETKDQAAAEKPKPPGVLELPPLVPQNMTNVLSKEELDVSRPFSSLKPNNVRIFNFPHELIGTMGSKAWANTRAQGILPIINFQSFWFKANELLWDNPTLMRRFRSDEIYSIDFSDCDKNLKKLLESTAHIHEIKFITADTSDLDNAMIPLLNKFPKLVTLSIKQSKVTGDGLLKLKRLNKLCSLNVDAGHNFKPIYRNLKHMPALHLLSVSRVNLDADDIEDIVQATQLDNLSVSYNNIVDDETFKKFTTLKNLQHISLAGCKITPKSIEILKKFPRLNSFVPPRWSNKDIEKLHEALPKLHVEYRHMESANLEESYQEDLKNQQKQHHGEDK